MMRRGIFCFRLYCFYDPGCNRETDMRRGCEAVEQKYKPLTKKLKSTMDKVSAEESVAETSGGFGISVLPQWKS